MERESRHTADSDTYTLNCGGSCVDECALVEGDGVLLVVVSGIAVVSGKKGMTLLSSELSARATSHGPRANVSTARVTSQQISDISHIYTARVPRHKIIRQ